MEDEDSPIRLVAKAKKYRRSKRSTPSAGVSRDCKGKRASPRKYVEKLVRASAGPRAPPAQDTVTERQSVVRLGSDCAGYGSDYLALKLNGVKVETSFCAEIDPQKVALLHRVHDWYNDTDFLLYRDIKDRDNTAAPGCDVFITGAPCQAYSTAGRGAGLDDGKNRGVTIFYSLDYVRCKRPKVVVVENVRGLTFKKHQHILNDIIGVMKQLGYLTTWRVLNTRHHGIPQSRPRLYIVGIREDTCAHTFHWPKPVPECPGLLLRFLNTDNRCSKSSINDLNTTMLANVLFWMREKERSDGVDFLKSTSSSTTTYVLDAHAGNDFRHIMLDCSPCLTRARAQSGGHFVTALRRMMTVQEIGRLQGCPTSVTNALRGSHVTDDGIGAAFGDAMSINVLMRVLPRALYAAGLLRELPIDMWARQPPAQGLLPDVMYNRGQDVGDPL